MNNVITKKCIYNDTNKLISKFKLTLYSKVFSMKLLTLALGLTYYCADETQPSFEYLAM